MSIGSVTTLPSYDRPTEQPTDGHEGWMESSTTLISDISSFIDVCRPSPVDIHGCWGRVVEHELWLPPVWVADYAGHVLGVAGQGRRQRLNQVCNKNGANYKTVDSTRCKFCLIFPFKSMEMKALKLIYPKPNILNVQFNGRSKDPKVIPGASI